MKMIYNSLEELVSSCTTSGLTSCFPSFLLKQSANWEVVSGLINSEECRAELVSHPADGDVPTCVTWRSSSQGEYGHIELLLPA